MNNMQNKQFVGAQGRYAWDYTMQLQVCLTSCQFYRVTGALRTPKKCVSGVNGETQALWSPILGGNWNAPDARL